MWALRLYGVRATVKNGRWHKLFIVQLFRYTISNSACHFSSFFSFLEGIWRRILLQQCSFAFEIFNIFYLKWERRFLSTVKVFASWLCHLAFNSFQFFCRQKQTHYSKSKIIHETRAIAQFIASGYKDETRRERKKLDSRLPQRHSNKYLSPLNQWNIFCTVEIDSSFPFLLFCIQIWQVSVFGQWIFQDQQTVVYFFKISLSSCRDWFFVFGIKCTFQLLVWFEFEFRSHD